MYLNDNMLLISKKYHFIFPLFFFFICLLSENEDDYENETLTGIICN